MDTMIEYGGVVMQAATTQEFLREPQYDRRGNYKHSKVTIRAHCILNPNLNAYQPRFNSLVNTPAAANGRGVFGPRSLEAMLYTLSQPRKTLVYRMGDVEMVRSPDVGQTVDLANGPLVLPETRVLANYSNHTLHIQFSVQTTIDERTIALSPLLSHEFSMSEDIDADAFAVRTIRGRATFRSDRLAALNVRPDDFRAWLFHPIPNYMTRDVVHVVAEESGLALEYLIVDRERPFNLDSALRRAGVTRIEGVVGVRCTRPAYQQIAQNWVFTGLDIAGTVLGMRGGAAGAQQAAQGMSGIGSSVRNFIHSSVPCTIYTCNARVWGRRLTPHSLLSAVAHTVVTNRTSRAGFLGAYALDAEEKRDHQGEFVEVHLQLLGQGVNVNLGGGNGGVVNVFGGGLPLYPDTSTGFPDIDSILGVTNRFNMPNANILRQNNSRGLHLGGVVAAALREPGIAWTARANPADAQILNP